MAQIDTTTSRDNEQVNRRLEPLRRSFDESFDEVTRYPEMQWSTIE